MAEIIVVVGMFLLRLGVPLAITLALGYWLRRLDAKWQAEAMVQWADDDSTQKEIVDTLESLDIEHYCQKMAQFEDMRQALEPDCALLDIPCWMARLRATGRLPEECYDCELFALSLAS